MLLLGWLWFAFCRRVWLALFLSLGPVPSRRISFVRGHQTILRGFFAVEDRAAGAAHGHAVLDLLRANRAIGQRLGVIEPGLLEAELPRGAAFEVRDEHGSFGALPFQIGSRHQP